MTMEGLLIFDQQGDVIFSRLNDGMRRKIHDMAVQQELIAIDSVCLFSIDFNILSNNLHFIFSPWIIRYILIYWFNCSVL